MNQYEITKADVGQAFILIDGLTWPVQFFLGAVTESDVGRRVRLGDNGPEFESIQAFRTRNDPTYDIHYQAPWEQVRFQQNAESLKAAIMIASSKAICTAGEWSIVRKKNGAVVLKLQGQIVEA